jgi:hypothetical protein
MALMQEPIVRALFLVATLTSTFMQFLCENYPNLSRSFSVGGLITVPSDKVGFGKESKPVVAMVKHILVPVVSRLDKVDFA